MDANVVAWFASIMTLIGVFLVARFNVVGWFFKLAGCIGWFAFAALTGYSALYFEAGVFFLLNLYGLRLWRRMESTTLEA